MVRPGIAVEPVFAASVGVERRPSEVRAALCSGCSSCVTKSSVAAVDGRHLHPPDGEDGRRSKRPGASGRAQARGDYWVGHETSIGRGVKDCPGSRFAFWCNSFCRCRGNCGTRGGHGRCRQTPQPHAAATCLWRKLNEPDRSRARVRFAAFALFSITADRIMQREVRARGFI